MYKSEHSHSSIIDQYLYDDSYLAVPMPQDSLSLAKELRFYANYFAANRLSQSSKWANELLVTISSNSRADPFAPTAGTAERCDCLTENDLKNAKHGTFNKVFYEEPCPAFDALNLARTLFDLREYRKCAHVLSPFMSAANLIKSSLAQSCLFLRNYALYLVSE